MTTFLDLGAVEADDPLVVLATNNYIFVLRTSVSRSPLSRLFPPAVLAPTRGILRPVAGAVLLAHSLCDFLSFESFSSSQHSIPRIGSIKFAGVHLEQEESRDQTELPRTARLHGAISPVGVDGFFFGAAWDYPKG